MPRNGSPVQNRLARLLREHPLRFVCAWSQETTLRPCPLHDHPVIELVYHPTGRGVTTLADGTTLGYADESVVLYGANVPHDQTPALPGADVCVQVEASKAITALLPRVAYYPPGSDAYVGEEFWSLSRTPAHTGTALATVLDLRATALLLRLLISTDQREADTDVQTDYIRRANHYLRDHFATVPDMAAVADHIGVSEDYLRHLYKQREGRTLNQSLNRIRIERAKELLRHSRLPLKDIAEQCGFQTDRYFCTRFTTLVGLTPGEFRNQPRGPKPPPLPGENSTA
jgi:AraC-like DNA-binding protein